MKHSFYMPLEIKSRDFYPRLLLSLFLCKLGKIKVFIGHRGHVNFFAQNHQPGIYYGLATIRNFDNLYKNIKKNGNFLFISDEEGLLTYRSNYYKKFKVSRKILNLSDGIFVWGRKNSKILESLTSKNKIHIFGNPRIDLLNPKFSNVYKNELQKIKKKYGKYILICTTFSYINYFEKNIKYIDLLQKRNFFRSKRDIQDWKNYEIQKNNIKNELFKYIEHFSLKNKNINIIIRPHPSESEDMYIDLKKIPNVYVNSSYSVHPWLLGCEFLVNHYCTTTFEAMAAQKKIFTIKTNAQSKMENLDFFKITKVFNSYTKLLNYNTGKNFNFKTKIKLASQYVENFANTSFASEQIAKKIIEETKSKIFKKKKLNLLIYQIKVFFDFFKKFFYKKRSYVSHKIKKIDYYEIMQFISKIPQFNNQFNVKKICDNFFEINHVKKN
jgi:surface carbohydrate biosynthesis protein